MKIYKHVLKYTKDGISVSAALRRGVDPPYDRSNFCKSSAIGEVCLSDFESYEKNNIKVSLQFELGFAKDAFNRLCFRNFDVCILHIQSHWQWALEVILKG